MDGRRRQSGEGDWEAGVAGVMGLAVEIGKDGGEGKRTWPLSSRESGDE